MKLFRKALLQIKGKIIAVYSNNKPAAIKLKNKICIGFKPNEKVLAKLIHEQIGVQRT